MTDQHHHPAPSAADDLQRVREILFGAEQRRQSDELQRLATRFDEQLAAMRAETEEQHRRLADDLRATRRELEDRIRALSEGKIEREDLAEMFGGIVQRLGNAAKQLGG